MNTQKSLGYNQQGKVHTKDDVIQWKMCRRFTHSYLSRRDNLKYRESLRTGSQIDGVVTSDILADQVGHISIGAIQCLAVARASSTSHSFRCQILKALRREDKN